MTGQPVPKAMVYISSGGSSAGGTTDDRGHYRLICQDCGDRIRLAARPPDGSPLLGVSREFDKVPASGELTADFALPRAVVVSGRAVERGTGRPMLATQNQGCHGPGSVMGGRVWYRPLTGNASVTGNEAADYFKHALQGQQGLFVGLVESDGIFRGVVPPGPGVLLLEAFPGMPFMWQFSLPTKESDGLHKRFPYAPLAHRELADGAPRVAGEAGEALPGTDGPIALEGLVAYKVIEPAANDASFKVEITIPTALTRRIRFVDPAGRPVRGAVVFGLTSSPDHQVILDGDEVEVLGLEPNSVRRLAALSPDGRLHVETTIRTDSAEPITIQMGLPAAVTGRLTDEQGKAVAGAYASVQYLTDEVPPIPRPRGPALTDADGRFRVEGIFPGNTVKVEFSRAGKGQGPGEHFRPEVLRKLKLNDGQTRDVGTVKAKSEPW